MPVVVQAAFTIPVLPCKAEVVANTLCALLAGAKGVAFCLPYYLSALVSEALRGAQVVVVVVVGGGGGGFA